MSGIERITVTAGGTLQSVLRLGAPDAPPLLLIHGLGWDAERLWAGLMPRFADLGFHALAPDLRGVGQSAALDRPIDIAGYADDLSALLASLELPQATVIGFSMGGMIGTELARRGHADALALACAGLTSSPEGQRGVEAMLARARDIGPEVFAEEQAQAIWHRGWAVAHPEAVADFRRWRAEMDQPGLHHAFRAPFGTDLAPAFAALDIPLRVIAAADDPFLKVEAARAIAASNPRADLALIPRCGHMAPIEQPDAFFAACMGLLARTGETKG